MAKAKQLSLLGEAKNRNQSSRRSKVTESAMKKSTTRHATSSPKKTTKKKTPGRPRKWRQGTFGGEQFKNYNPREQRPIEHKQALHVVMRSSLAKGKWSMLHPDLQEAIWQTIEKHSKINNIRIYEYANGGNHLHLLIRVKSQDDYKRFIRTITGLIARLVTGAKRGEPLKRPFWDARPFTRIVYFGVHDFKKTKLYLKRNTWEAVGFISHLKRSPKLTPEWKAFWDNLVSVPLESK